MSAYKKIKCSLVDKPTLLSALKEMGLATEVHETAQTLYGYGNHARPEKAEIIVRQKDLNKSFTGASNDLGFAWNADTKQYDAICSDYDAGLKMIQRLTQAYAKVAIQEALKSHRFNIDFTKSTGDVSQRARQKVTLVATKVM